MLYEFVFAHSDFESGFHLYFQVPQTLVPCSSNSILEEEGLPQCWQLKNVLTILGDIEMNVCSMLNLLCSTTLVV